MSTKKKLLEKINKRMDMINEDVPPPVTFNEHEVLKMMCELIGYDLGGKAEPPKN